MQNNLISKDSAYYQTYFVDIKANPFVKWAGGKRQIISEIHNYLPKFLETNSEITYIEPFVGGGALYFSLSSSPNIKETILIDINPILIITYKIIKSKIDELITTLSIFEQKYKKANEEKQSNYYYSARSEYNNLIRKTDLKNFQESWIRIAALFIFLNRTCYNGLYRVNSQGEFNVPRGSYRNPKICDSENLYHVHKALTKTKIIHGDFADAGKYLSNSSFVYLDPPYRPLKSSGFTSYTKNDFDDNEQRRLADFCNKIHNCGGKFLLSNSDPKNIDPDDDFFENLYSKFNISRIEARRNINSNGDDRGIISELLIMNY